MMLLFSDGSPAIGFWTRVNFMNRSTDFGLYRIQNNSWQFCVRPEAGIIYKLADTFSATAGVKYYANFENDDLGAQTYFTVNIGAVFNFGY
jgi:hypothetical protein